ncbi:hypothetical protein GLA29479_1950 [Lysobacter antibioticus]|uniref:Uncharacterized protein n=1 Tax=Lysobacter antibioticus TaxID=84531 RepID=A0A0S2F7G4_LYSAN|nr:hypothetical protein GLA29479_1950 [Lysobacter antibioticus]ALN79409.1 hypothetical protein LA76x_1249 [Lysobacter antibioticus]
MAVSVLALRGGNGRGHFAWFRGGDPPWLNEARTLALCG